MLIVPEADSGHEKDHAQQHTRSYKPGVIMKVQYRAKNNVGAKVVTQDEFLIQEGKVAYIAHGSLGPPTEVIGPAPWVSAPYPNSIAAERLGDKLISVIVRGQITQAGKPLDMDAEVYFVRSKDADYGAWSQSWRNVSVSIRLPNGYEFVPFGGASAPAGSGKYEVINVPIGKVKVVVTWAEKSMIKECVIRDNEEVQTIDFDVEADKAGGQ